MNVHPVAAPCATHGEFFDRAHVLNTGRSRTNSRHDVRCGHTIHQVGGGRSHQRSTVPGDHARRDQCGPVVCAFPARTTGECDRDADECRGRCQRVAPMMLRVSCQSGAACGSRNSLHPLRHQLLDHDHRGQHAKRPWRGCVMRRANLVNRCHRDSDARKQQQQRHRRTSNRLGLAEAEGVFLGRIAIGDPYSSPDRE